MQFEIEFAAAVEKHLKVLTAHQRQMVFAGIEAHLTDQPTVTTRNRKPMRPNPLASWELRLGDLRVYYRVRGKPEAVVQIAAVGVKKREQVWIGREKVDL
ncbi:MAG TPA: hypothetical protein VN541_02645 [Tepidisphaeraceae bacterium]|nr:hypothetical protein [Tepidisphaeraceae bacterium]